MASDKPMRRASRTVAVAAVLLLLVLVVWVAHTVGHWSYSPLRLRRGTWYARAAPELLRYCAVPIGSSAEQVEARLGPPTHRYVLTDPAWTMYLQARTRAGWSPPTDPAGVEVLVYEIVSGTEMIVAYYFLDETGRVSGAHVGET